MQESTVKSHPATERVAQAAHEAVDRASGPAGRAEERLRESASNAQACGQEMTGKVTDYVRSHPLTSIGIAAAAGLVIGALLRR